MDVSYVIDGIEYRVTGATAADVVALAVHFRAHRAAMTHQQIGNVRIEHHDQPSMSGPPDDGTQVWTAPMQEYARVFASDPEAPTVLRIAQEIRNEEHRRAFLMLAARRPHWTLLSDMAASVDKSPRAGPSLLLSLRAAVGRLELPELAVFETRKTRIGTDEKMEIRCALPRPAHHASAGGGP